MPSSWKRLLQKAKREKRPLPPVGRAPSPGLHAQPPRALGQTQMRLEGTLTPPHRSTHESVWWVTLGTEAWKEPRAWRRSHKPWTQKLRVRRGWRGMLSHRDTPNGRAQHTRSESWGVLGRHCADPQNTFIHVGFSELTPRAALSRVGYSTPAAFNSKPTRCYLPGNTTVPGPCVNQSPYHIPFPSSLGRQTQVEILSGFPLTAPLYSL